MLVLAQLPNAEFCMRMVGNLNEAKEHSKLTRQKRRKKVKITIRKRAVNLINKEYLSFKKNAHKKLINIKNRLVCENLAEFVKEYEKQNLFFYNQRS